MLTVVAIYLSASAAVMFLVSPEQLARSTAPFSDAARAFGPWGGHFVAAGALVATAGTLNGLIFSCGQMPMAIALDKLAPSWLAATTKGGAPHLSLWLSSALASVFLLLNYSRGFIGAFTFLLMMATALGLIYYFVVSLAELRHSWKSAFSWAAVAMIAIVYSLFAAFGSGLEVLLWGLVLMAVGVPLYFICKQRETPAAAASRPS
jgi:APA family basic amino acid/polyamine antiporter